MINKYCNKCSVASIVKSDFEYQLETTDFNNEEDMDDSYQYMITQLDIHYRSKDVDDNSLDLRNIADIINILDDIEKYTLKHSYEAIVEYLDKLEE